MLELSPKLRSALYTISIVVMPVIAYLAEQETISTFVAGLFVVVNSAALLRARVNVSEK